MEYYDWNTLISRNQLKTPTISGHPVSRNIYHPPIKQSCMYNHPTRNPHENTIEEYNEYMQSLTDPYNNIAEDSEAYHNIYEDSPTTLQGDECFDNHASLLECDSNETPINHHTTTNLHHDYEDNSVNNQAPSLQYNPNSRTSGDQYAIPASSPPSLKAKNKTHVIWKKRSAVKTKKLTKKITASASTKTSIKNTTNFTHNNATKRKFVDIDTANQCDTINNYIDSLKDCTPMNSFDDITSNQVDNDSLNDCAPLNNYDPLNNCAPVNNLDDITTKQLDNNSLKHCAPVNNSDNIAGKQVEDSAPTNICHDLTTKQADNNSLKDSTPINNSGDIKTKQVAKETVTECTTITPVQPCDVKPTTQQEHDSSITHMFSTINWNVQDDPVTFEHIANTMTKGFWKQLTKKQKALLHETILLNKHLVETRVLTISAATNSIHDTLKYFLNHAMYNMSNATSTQSVADVNNNLVALIIENKDVYYNSDIYLQQVQRLFARCSGKLRIGQMDVLQETIALNKHLVDNQEIIVSEAISRVCLLLQHFQQCSHTIRRSVSCSPLTIPTDSHR